jgi:hypothetical protein
LKIRNASGHEARPDFWTGDHLTLYLTVGEPKVESLERSVRMSHSENVPFHPGARDITLEIDL